MISFLASQDEPTLDSTLAASQTGDGEATDRLTSAVYEELKRLAGSFLRRERENHSLQATALVHEAYLKLIDQDSVDWKNRSHFLAIAAVVMRRILIDHANRKGRAKRGGGRKRLMIETIIPEAPEPPVDLIELDVALTSLAKIDPDMSRLVEMRFFGGMTEVEIADVLGVSTRTVRREWALARAWLRNELDES